MIVQYPALRAPERPIVVKDLGTPAAYSPPISDVDMDLGDADNVGGMEGVEGVGALGLIMDPTPMPSSAPPSNSVTGEEVPYAVRDGGDDSAAAAQVLIPGQLDVEMDGGSAETSCKASEPEPEPESGETDSIGTRSSATRNVSMQEVVEMCLGGGEGEGGDGSKIASGSTSAGEGPVTENTGVDANISIVNTDKYVLLRDTIAIPCGPDLPAHPRLKSILHSLQPSSVSPVSPARFFPLREGQVFIGLRPVLWSCV